MHKAAGYTIVQVMLVVLVLGPVTCAGLVSWPVRR